MPATRECAPAAGQDELALAKARFLEAAQAWQPLNSVRSRPWRSLALAFGLGYLLTRRPPRGASFLAVLPLLLQSLILSEKAVRVWRLPGRG